MPPINKTMQALSILNDVYTQTTALLNAVSPNGTGHAQLGELFEQIRDDMNDAKKRSETETLRLGILGGRGSGKSSLANALMGDNYLPESALIFCTSLPTTIKFSTRNFLGIESELKEQSYEGVDIKDGDIKKRLQTICKESENPNNEKMITKITIGLPQGILDGKEIVDVPGFTKGNPLHQAFAERYAKHYCDVCIVLINNSESVEIGSYQGLEALARTFSERLDSTVFVINKCDESQDNDLKYIKKQLRDYLKGQDPIIFEVSARNSLADKGKQYQFQDLLGHLAHISTRRNLILVRASIGRLVSNFRSLQELCQLAESDLDALYQDINGLLVTGISEYKKKLERNLSREQILPKVEPSLDISAFDLPQNSLGLPPNEYAKRLAQSIKSQLTILEEFIQKHQANIYRSYNSQYEMEIDNFSKDLQAKVREFETRFNISTTIEPPTVENRFQKMNFDPSRIEKLKPFPFRLWLEQKLPGVLVRDVKFWLSPISISYGGLSMKIGIPIGVESAKDMTEKFKQKLPDEAIKIMNEYLYTSLDEFVRQLQADYSQATNKFAKDWEKCLRGYISRIEIAKIITSRESQRKFDNLIKNLDIAHERVGKLVSQD